jgi:hypothetical protein
MVTWCLCTTLAFCFAAADGGRFGVYKEIYPPLERNDSLVSLDYYNRSCTPDDPCPLFFTFLISFGGLYVSDGALPGVQVALDEINKDPTILPGYTLHYTLHDSSVSYDSFVLTSNSVNLMFVRSLCYALICE